MNYSLKRVAPDMPRRLVSKFHTDLLSATILSRRGVTEGKDIKFFLESNLSYLHSPFLFEDMDSAVQRILNAKEDGEKVCVFGDRDADGITSTALLVSELKANGIETSYKLPEGDSPYGLTLDAVKSIKAEGITLVITVDCGISNIEEIKALSEEGIDAIVVDHHLPGEELPSAIALINPKMKESGYPFEHLAGCGVVSKLIFALRFAQSEFYNEDIILLHAEPGPGENTTTVVQAVEIENLVEKGRVIEELPNGAVDFEHSQLVSFLNRGLPIMVLDREVELLALRKAFGKGVDISLIDFRSELERVIPKVKGKSLFTLSTESRAVRYEDGREELETLISLFKSYCIYSQSALSKEFEALLDLVAIGTIADLMPLLDENRILVRLGLKRLSSAPREALIPLLSAQNLISRPINCQDVGWSISPVINASGRLGCPSVAAELLLSDSPMKAAELTEKLLSLNRERQRLGEEAWQKAQPLAKESLEHFGSKFLMVKDDDIPRGLTGVLASRLLKEFPEAPAAMVLADAGEGRISASIRSEEYFPSRDFLSRFEDILLDYGGHRCAGGFSMKAENYSAFLDLLEEEVLSMDIGESEEEIPVDAVIPTAYMNPNIIKVVELFEPYGEQNPPLTFMIDDAEVVEAYEIGQDRSRGNLRLSVKFGSMLWPCVFWGAKNRLGSDFDVSDHVRLIFRMGRNYWKGSASIQLTVLDLEKINE